MHGKLLSRSKTLEFCFKNKLENNGLIKLPEGFFRYQVFFSKPKYLGRYTHRTAISNDRIQMVSSGQVTFTWKDYTDNSARKTTTMKADQFLGLFCQHILPPGYTRIRHYGFLSSASKSKSLALIRKSLGTPIIAGPLQAWQQIVFCKMGITPGVCKCCGGRIRIIETLPNQFRNKARAPPVKIPENANNWKRAC